jgi:hypothetical protein
VTAFAIRNTTLDGRPVDVTIADGHVRTIEAASAPNRYRIGADDSSTPAVGRCSPGSMTTTST